MKNFITNFSEPERLKLQRYTKNGTKIIYSIFRFVLLLSIGYIILYPLLYMIVTSLVSGEAYRNSTRVWIPTQFDIIDNFKMAVGSLDYGITILHTFKYEVSSALIEVASCAVIGYGFARFNFKGKKVFMGILLLTILVPDIMLMIPRIVNFTRVDIFGILGMIDKLTGVDLRINIMDTPFAFWIPSLLGVGLRSGILIYIYIQFFSSLPRELEEAAWVDGAGPIKTFLSIAVPSSSVVFTVVFMFSMIWHWNDNLISSMYLTDEFTIANRLSMFEVYMEQKYGLTGVTYGAVEPQAAAVTMAGCLLCILPMLIMYMLLQRRFIESIDRVGITG